MNFKKIRNFISVLISLITVFSLISLPATNAAGEGDGKGILAYGIDVSSWQGEINWKKVKADGISFAILRIGTTNGKDTYFEQNYKNARSAGVDIGCYFYTYATSTDEAKADADMVLSWLDGKQLEYPVYYDMEDKTQLASGITTAKRTQMCMTFLETLSEKGWYVGTYANANWFSNYLNKSELGKEHELWLASWMDSGQPSRDYSAQYGLWQYTSSGTVNGINGRVDRDVAYRDYPTIIKNGGYNGYSAVIEEANEEWIITSSDGVNVRQGAGTSFEKVGFLPNGTRIHVTGKMEGNNYTWGRIKLDNGETAWCVLNFAKKTVSTLLPANSKYTVISNQILGIEAGTIIMEDDLKVSGFAEIQMPKTVNCGTGQEVNLLLAGEIVNTYYVVVSGDINGDSYIDAIDLTISSEIANAELQYEKASPYFTSADINGDGTCDIFDTLIIAAKAAIE